MSSNPHGSTAGLVPLKEETEKRWLNIILSLPDTKIAFNDSLDYNILTMDLH